MQLVIVAWCKTNAHDFERHVPLAFVGERNQRLGFSNDIKVIFLQGFSLLNQTYRQTLQSLGYELYDGSVLYEQCAKTYSNLDRFGDYEKKCFLRWLVLEQLFAGEALIHVDGDIVFNESPAIIAKLAEKKTFVLQGCPAFTVVSDRIWFEQYRAALNAFIANIDHYSAHAWQQRDGWQITCTTRWAGSRFRNIITSDQDLISHLIHTGQLVQESVETIMKYFSAYILFENPLFVHLYDNNFPYRYKRYDGIDFFEGVRHDGATVPFKKRVLFWHMQSCFNFYLSKFIMRQGILWPLQWSRLPLHVSSRGWEEYINKRVGRLFGGGSRLAVYRYFFDAHDFSGIFKRTVWWKEGIFE